ncbi:hypothetical protein LGN06_29270 [Burkholderia vietnamiensis]|uniref:hypothetical protein n=1 Tax=Burkholderia vietnamiensis TaxID=60552 RepID=UPI001CF36390|nr:hypothetical protein [Burkholderia vietnamiensis]MCA8395638.1 hypothetical protein [Burkholderia vietnamiensis]HDR8961811.1 hypothetical protein [Burkholderia vietnamiensis]HDR9247901.1 hypothetical protein [Burkholderia vietnamiensis]
MFVDQPTTGLEQPLEHGPKLGERALEDFIVLLFRTLGDAQKCKDPRFYVVSIDNVLYLTLEAP